MTTSLIGQKLGKYEIIELLGQGGMATVYKGYQADIDRFVAIKVLPPHPGQNSNFIDRFRLEARTIAQLQHPHILPMHDYGTEKDVLYLVMSYVSGGSLKDRIAQGPMTLNEVEVLLRQIASAMDYAHRHGVLHRDIKPDNVLIDSEGHALLADFGVAKILKGDTSGGLTATGGVLGTPAYMAPEQGQGMDLTPEADIYSLGVIVYEMLTGHQPFSADTPMQVVLKHITEPVPNILNGEVDLPAGLEPVMRQVLAKQPEQRYDSAMAFAQEFLRAIHQNTTAINVAQVARPRKAVTVDSTTAASAPLVAPPPPTPTNPTNPTNPEIIISQSGMNPLVLLGGFAIIAIMVVLVVMLIVNNNNPSPVVSVVNTEIPTEIAATEVPPTDVPQPTALAAINGTDAGRVSYSTSSNLGDTITIEVQDLAPLDNGAVYALWLHNTANDEALNIGELTPSAEGVSGLNYTDGERRMLPAFYNQVLITRETTIGDAPGEDVIYQAQLPDNVTAALNEIFVYSQRVADSRLPQESLFGGARTVAETALIHTSLDHSPHTVFWLRNRTEHTINVLSSTQEDYDGNEVPENPGFDVGLGELLDSISERLTGVTSTADVNLQQSTQRLSFCINNVRRWESELIDLQLNWLERTDLADDDTDRIQGEINKATDLVHHMLEGVDFNQDGQIENFPGECGLQQIPNLAISMATMTLQKLDEA